MRPFANTAERSAVRGRWKPGFATLWALLAGAAGACSEPASSSSTDRVGTVALAMDVVPEGVGCVRVTAAGAARVVKTSFDVEPGTEGVLRDWHGVPLGPVNFSGDALAGPCDAVTPESEPTYAADPVTVNVVPSRTVTVMLTMRPWGRVDVDVAFEGGPECTEVISTVADETMGPWSSSTGAASAEPACLTGSSTGVQIQRYPRLPGQFVDDVYPLFDGLLSTREATSPAGARATPGDNNLYAGIWREGSDAYAAWFSTSWNEFTSRWETFGNAGLRMDDFETYFIGSHRVFAGLFRAGTDAHAAWFTSDWDQFTQQWEAWGAEGLRMHDFETFVDGGQRVYAGIFRAGTDANAAWITSDWESFTSQWEALGRSGLRMHDFEVYFEGDTPVYAGIFREGTDANAALFTSDWNEFTSTWDDLVAKGLRMHDFETYQIGNTRVWAGAWREGSGGHAAWIGVDWESFASKWHELSPFNLRLVDLEAYPSACPAECLNQLVMPPDLGQAPTAGLYNYGITRTTTHCADPPGTCGTPGPGDRVWYRQPVIADDAAGRFVRFSAVTYSDQIFTLPFTDANITHNGWLYKAGSWHHAVDYGLGGADSFDIVAAAPGTVVFVGWDFWSGGTIVVSHDAGGVVDAYRTIYMHVRNGADADCDRAWKQTYEPNKTADWAPHYKAYLEATGCTKDPASRNLAAAQWGSDSDTVPAGLLGKQVARGELLAKAGSTGPGGCGCIPDDPANAMVGSGGTGPNTHLHIFFARRDPTDNRWYFFDPYGTYGPPQCYPAGLTDAPKAACARYSVGWQNGAPAFP